MAGSPAPRNWTVRAAHLYALVVLAFMASIIGAAMDSFTPIYIAAALDVLAFMGLILYIRQS